MEPIIITSSPPTSPARGSKISTTNSAVSRHVTKSRIFVDENSTNRERGHALLAHTVLQGITTSSFTAVEPVSQNEFLPTSKKAGAEGPPEDNLLNILEDLGDFYLPARCLSKRRKLSVSGTFHTTNINSEDIIHDLSSEPDYQPSRSRISVASRTSIYDLDTVDEKLPLREEKSRSNGNCTSGRATADVEIVDLSSDPMPDIENILASRKPKENHQSKSQHSAKPQPTSNSRPGSTSRRTGISRSLNGIGFKTSKSQSIANKELVSDEIVDSSQPGPQSKKLDPKRAVNLGRVEEKERKRIEKEALKAAKDREKEQKKLDKQIAADIAEVNKRKTDRKVTTCEMILELPSSLRNKSVGTQVSHILNDKGAEVRFCDETFDLTTQTPLPGKIIRWKRRVKSEYNLEREEWTLTSPRVDAESHILVYLTAQDLCTIMAPNPDSPPAEGEILRNLDVYIRSLREDESAPVVLLLEGTTTFVKRQSNAKNREYAAQVRDQVVSDDLVISSSQNTTSRKRKPTTDLSFFTADLVETAELHLQLNHAPLQIHHTTSAATSAQQIAEFTQHLSTRPYRTADLRYNLSHASFSIASGQVKTGADKKETWVKMLEQVNRVTVGIAHGVCNAGYESPAELVAAFKATEAAGSDARQGREQAQVMLQDAPRAANRFGADADKRLGPMVSRRLYKVFMSTDPDMREGIV